MGFERARPVTSEGISDLIRLSFQGNIHLLFHSSGNRYVWSKVTSTVHNIIVGKLWIDQVCSRVTCHPPATRFLPEGDRRDFVVTSVFPVL